MSFTRWTWLTGLAVLFAGLSNAHSHVHYCFDGQEPPATVHLSDGTHHEHEHPGHTSHEDATQHNADEADHDDLDLDLPNQALAKAVKHDLFAIAPALGWSNGIDTRPAAALARIDDAPPAPDPLYARPPLRGPPR
jgi:hypothetical protein